MAIENSQRRFIGYAGVMPSRQDHPLGPHAEIGWRLARDAWGHGYATEAAGAVIDQAFADGLGHVVAVVLPGNTASTAVCARLGMEPLGVTDRYYDTEMEAFRLASPVMGGEDTTSH